MYISASELEPEISNPFNTFKSFKQKSFNSLMFGDNKKTGLFKYLFFCYDILKC